nr:hypothetical protein [Tanacetum cinerariifolium]
MMVSAHLIGRIARFNGLGQGELFHDKLDDSRDEAAVAEARRAQDEEGGVRHHPNMLRAMDDRLGDINFNIYTLSNEIAELTVVVSRMSEQYDQFYEEFDRMRLEKDRFHTWNTDYISQLLSSHHINHTRYDGTQYSYVPNIPDLEVQQGVNFMTILQIFSTAPTAPIDPFSLFGKPGLDLLLHTTLGMTWTRSDSSFVFRLKNNLCF